MRPAEQLQGASQRDRMNLRQLTNRKLFEVAVMYELLTKAISVTRVSAASLGVVVVVMLAAANTDLFGQTKNAEIKVEATFSERQIPSNENLVLRFNRPLKESDGTLAVLIGTSDVSSLFTQDGLISRYDAKRWPLPVGETVVSLYLVSKADDWTELARFTLRVVKGDAKKTQNQPNVDEQAATSQDSEPFDSSLDDNPDGDQTSNPKATASAKSPSATTKPSDTNSKMSFKPSLTLTIPSQPAQSTFPGPRPPRATFTELNIQASIKNEITYGALTTQSTFEFSGSSFQQEALRFGVLGNEAPKLDLAGYQIHLQTGKVKFDVGHFSYGSQRQLINGFSSRGLQVSVPFLEMFDFTAAAMNGTQLVGYDNFFGLDTRKHQLLTGTLGVELIRKRPGGLRVEISGLNAYFQPLGGVNRGVVTDLQRSNGVSVRLIANDKNRRFHFEGGFTRSLFGATNDATLNQGTAVVALPSLSRNAHYLEASFDILRNYSLTKTKRANLNVSFREENVAPLFRSLGAATQSDKIQYDFIATGSINEISAQFSQVNFHDNLRRIPSILRSLTGATHLGFAAPASSLLNRTTNSPWLPRLAYSFDRAHARGDAIPVNGGFDIDPSTVPDLVGTNQTFSADWQVKKFTWGYNINRSFQDNRQKTRERSDLGVLVNTGRVGIAATRHLNFNIDLSADSSENKERNRIDRTYRIGPGVAWQMTKQMGLSANLANTIAGDAANTSHTRNTGFDFSWTYRFEHAGERSRKIAGQFFIRYANNYSRALDRLLITDILRKSQTLTANLGITFF